MGQQQLLLIILGVIIVGIAVAIGISLFQTNKEESDKDQCVQDINSILQNAYQFRIKPSSLGGGNNSYTGYAIPAKMVSNVNLDVALAYALDGTPDATSCKVKAASATVATYLNGIGGGISAAGIVTITGR